MWSKDNKPKIIVEGIHDSEEYNNVNSKYVYFGTDLSKIPCFRSTFIYAILGGIGCGLLTFLATSRVRLSTDIAMYSFGGIGMTYWVTCGIKHTNKKLETREKMKTWDINGGPFDDAKWEELTKNANSNS